MAVEGIRGTKRLILSSLVRRQLEPALIYDSVYALARGLQALERGATLRPVNVSCDEEKPWNDGSSLFNYVNSVSEASGARWCSCI